MKNGRCRMHGGNARRGPDHPRFKTGKHSKVIPERMAATYDAAVKDRQILALQADVALLDARIEDLLRRVDTGEAGTLWRDAWTAFQGIQEAIRERDNEKGLRYTTQLRMILQQGRDDYRAWDEVGKVLEQKRRMIESESKRQVQERFLVPIVEMGLIVRALAGAVSTHVGDVEVLRAINRDWELVLGRDSQTNDGGVVG